MRAQRVLFSFIQLAGIAGIFSISTPAHAIGFFSPAQKSYVLNLCEYYDDRYDTRLGRINMDLRLTGATLTLIAQTIPSREKGNTCAGGITERMPLKSTVQSNIVIEIEGFSEASETLRKTVLAQLDTANAQCDIQTLLEVKLLFSKLDNGAAVDGGTLILKRTGRGGVYVYESTRGKSLSLLEQGSAIKEPAELLQPEIRCAKR